MTDKEKFKIPNTETSIRVTRRTQGLAKATKKHFRLHSLEETIYLALKFLNYMKGKYPGFGKAELWKISGVYTKDFELIVHVQGDVAKPFKEGFGDFDFKGIEKKKKVEDNE